jgi:hypothetical protein
MLSISVFLTILGLATTLSFRLESFVTRRRKRRATAGAVISQLEKRVLVLIRRLFKLHVGVK